MAQAGIALNAVLAQSLQPTRTGPRAASAATLRKSNRQAFFAPTPLLGVLTFGLALFLAIKLLGIEPASQKLLFVASGAMPLAKVGLMPLALLFAFLCASFASLAFIAFRHGILHALSGAALKLLLSATFYFVQVLAIAAVPLLLLCATAYFLQLKGISGRQLALELGLASPDLRRSSVQGLLLYIFTIAFVVAAGLAISAAGLNDSKNVYLKVSSLPIEALVVAIILSPLAEEIFFRGFLLKRAGMLATSIIFAMGHLAYSSISEILLAFSISVIFCAAYLRWKNLYGLILAHALFNLTSIVIMLALRNYLA
ncbi:CPBP family intramembrane metalloprotease [Candidatus Parvarchaeota archaeon]|nr:CPBP family intramembrane metalloprotease [Candidatus Parvarchaeota archaeon]